MVEPPLIYIAGPYTGATHDAASYHEIDMNISRAREAAAWCAENGLYFFCPHLNSAHFEVITPSVPSEYWYGLDLRILRACDALLLLSGWQLSRGVKKELEEAFAMKIESFLFTEDGKQALLNWEMKRRE